MAIKVTIPPRPRTPKTPKTPKAPKASWIGTIKGHDKEFAAKLKADLEARERAARTVNSTILTREEVQGDKVLTRNLSTTLGGKLRALKPQDLETFRNNALQTKVTLQSQGGITPQQVLNLAKGRPLNYNGLDILSTGIKSDVDKARREITSAVLVSAVGGDLRFITPSGGESRANRHVVLVRLKEWENALGALAGVSSKDEGAYRRVADTLRKGKVAFECDCERHRYYFRYLATLGGFNAGRPETGYPKIRNPGLKGVACKHVIRVMTELLHSPAVLRFLIKHLKAYDGENLRDDHTTQMLQRDANKIREKKGRDIRNSEQQAKADARALRAKEKRQRQREEERKWSESHSGISLKRRSRAAESISRQETKKPAKTAGASRAAGANSSQNALKNPKVQLLIKQYGLTAEQAAALFAAAGE